MSIKSRVILLPHYYACFTIKVSSICFHGVHVLHLEYSVTRLLYNSARKKTMNINDLIKRHAKYLMKGMTIPPKQSVTPGSPLPKSSGKKGRKPVKSSKSVESYSAAPSVVESQS